MSHSGSTSEHAAQYLSQHFNPGIVHSYQDIRKSASERLYGGKSFFGRIFSPILRRIFLDDGALDSWEDKMWKYATIFGLSIIPFAFIGSNGLLLGALGLVAVIFIVYLPERIATRHFEMWDSSWEECPDCFSQRRELESALRLYGLEPWDYEIVFPRRPVRKAGGEWSCTRVALISFKELGKQGQERTEKLYFEFGSMPAQPANTMFA